MTVDHPTEEERCPYCGEEACEASCTAALVQDARRGQAEEDGRCAPSADAVAGDDAPQPCGHPWSAVVWQEDETGDCGACLKEERRARGEEEP